MVHSLFVTIDAYTNQRQGLCVCSQCAGSLRSLDLSWNGMGELFNDTVVNKLAARPATSQLRDIDLTGNTVSAKSIRSDHASNAVLVRSMAVVVT